ncbi:PfkB domain protein [Ferroglobus placidus DSM 10642]|uniref:PfkB domain protein n=1 Tax=Ferroglobus placidus (strain DSM 10642 / AEDII12DO) TaxID=589924 RepID=D3RXK1_FERPA|nr:carbohydrate kinase family protein [Ferroglobus placidus]ADC65214.1 PfkB domain protein [Ferroglobus placidus DSM 10642]
MIVGFGALNLDKIYLVDKIPREDEEGYVIDVELHPGGSAANTIAGLASFGVKTGYVGKVGSDAEGEMLVEDFRKRGVDLSGIVKSEGRSGQALIFVDRNGNRAILVDPGVNDTIKFEEVNKELIEKAEIVHMTSFICKNGTDSLESQKKVAKVAKAVSFDPGLPYVERGLEEIREIVERTTILLPNKTEIEKLVGKDFREAAKEMIEEGVKVVAVKLGEKGCYVTDGKEEHFIEAFKANVVDTTGAGDAFNAGFLYGWMKGKSLEACGKLGNYVASKIVERVGARNYEGIDPEKFV